MCGAILGDIIDNPYEFDRGNKTKESPQNENKNTLLTKETIERSSLFCTFKNQQKSMSSVKGLPKVDNVREKVYYK